MQSTLKESHSESLSCLLFASRSNEPPNLFQAGQLSQEYVCDAMASADQSNLNWIRNNQRKLRADLYSGLQDHMACGGGVDMENVGHVVILPSSHKGSAQYMQQLLQDSLAICRENKKPDLFLTMTANGNWQEIVKNILPGQTATN